MEHIKELLYKMADDALIIGHRNSEWTGLGPTLEEDISFSSMAQDKVGHALNLYQILNEQHGEADPDALGFKREEKNFKSCHLVEYPIHGITKTEDGGLASTSGGYDFSLIRQFLFDHAEYARYMALTESTYRPLANFAKKVKGEIKYHIIHADTWIQQLGNGSEESHARMQNALNEVMPLALGIFEEGDFEGQLISDNTFIGEKALKEKWLEDITPIIERSNLKMPNIGSLEPALGGRKGYHTEHLKFLLDEMTEVMALDPRAEW